MYSVGAFHWSFVLCWNQTEESWEDGSFSLMCPFSFTKIFHEAYSTFCLLRTSLSSFKAFVFLTRLEALLESIMRLQAQWCRGFGILLWLLVQQMMMKKPEGNMICPIFLTRFFFMEEFLWPAFATIVYLLHQATSQWRFHEVNFRWRRCWEIIILFIKPTKFICL